jgi:hypothetical protein
VGDEVKRAGQGPGGNSGVVRFADIARSLFAEPTVLRTLQRIVDVAVENIGGCEGAGVLLVSGGKIVSGAWSNDVVRELEQTEYDIGEGPCVDAILERPAFESSDLRDEVSLWPRFVAHALELGVESMIAFRLFAAEETLGALDLYGGRRGAFDEAARAFGTVYAAQAAMALVGSRVHEHDLAVADGLRVALVTRDVIGQAKGILMATRHVDADTAFELLRSCSQRVNIKLREVAEQVVFTGELPPH